MISKSFQGNMNESRLEHTVTPDNFRSGGSDHLLGSVVTSLLPFRAHENIQFKTRTFTPGEKMAKGEQAKFRITLSEYVSYSTKPSADFLMILEFVESLRNFMLSALIST